MKCEKYEMLISQYIENDITDVEKEELELHLASCEDCRKQLEALRFMQGMLKQEDKDIKISKIRTEIYSKIFRDFLIMFAGLVIIVSVVSVSGGLAQMFLLNQMSSKAGIFFLTGILLLIVGLIILMYDIFADLFRIMKNK